VDGRKGIDSPAALCREKLPADPFSEWVFVFRTRRMAQKRLSKGRFHWWPVGTGSRTLETHQAQLPIAAGNPETAAAPVWRRVS